MLLYYSSLPVNFNSKAVIFKLWSPLLHKQPKPIVLPILYHTYIVTTEVCTVKSPVWERATSFPKVCSILGFLTTRCEYITTQECLTKRVGDIRVVVVISLLECCQHFWSGGKSFTANIPKSDPLNVIIQIIYTTISKSKFCFYCAPAQLITDPCSSSSSAI